MFRMAFIVVNLEAFSVSMTIPSDAPHLRQLSQVYLLPLDTDSASLQQKHLSDPTPIARQV